MSLSVTRIKIQFASLLALLVVSVSALQAADAVAVSYPPVVQGSVRGLAVDGSGTKFVIGNFQGTLDFNPGVGEDSKTSVGNSDVFITRFEADDTYTYTKTFGGTGSESPRSIVLAGKLVYVAGSLQSTDAGFGSAGSVATLGKSDVFIWALDAKTGETNPDFGTGGVQKFGGTGNDDLSQMIGAGSNLILTGNFDSTDAGVGALGAIKALSASDSYVLVIDAKKGLVNDKFGTGGAVVFGGTNQDFVTSMTLAGSTIILSGNMTSTDFGVAGAPLLKPLGQTSIFLLALNSKDGKINDKFGTLGGLVIGGTKQDGNPRVVAKGSQLYVGGIFSSSDFGVGALGTNAPVGNFDVFLLALSAKDGKPNEKFGKVGFVQFGGTGEESLSDIVVSKAIYLTGQYSGSDAKIGATTVPASVGKSDIFVLALNPKDGTQMTKSIFGFANFGGSESESAGNLAVSKKVVLVSGRINSTDAGYGAAGAFSTVGGFQGLVVPFDIVTGKQPVVKAKKGKSAPAAIAPSTDFLTF